MKVVFLQRDSFVKLGVEQLSAVLNQAGHECDLFIESGERHFLESAHNSGADLFAFSCTTGQEGWVLETASSLKKVCPTPIIVGGPHATFYPKLIENTSIDYICVGEGEQALIELLDAMANQPDKIKDICNIWSKNSAGEVHKTQIRRLIEDLDSIPSPDFGIYAKYKYIALYSLDIFPVMTSRGCPHSCSYCFNSIYRELYRNKGTYVRRRSPSHVIAELVEAKQRYGVRKVTFLDDSFFVFPSWLKEFSGLYKEKVNLPFLINVEATQVKEWLVRLVKEMGCICVRMGLESGNDNLREKVLNKKVTSQQIREAAGHIKRHGIKLATYNMVGLPGETVENAIETYKLNKQIGTDFTLCSILQPYPGTMINKYVSEKGYYKEKCNKAAWNESVFVSSSLRLDNEKELVNLQKLMQLFLQLGVPLWLVRKIIKLPRNPFFHCIFKLSFVYNKIRTQKMRVIPLARLALHSLSYMSSRPVKDS